MKSTFQKNLERYFLALDHSIYVSDCFGARDVSRYGRAGLALIQRYGYTENAFNRLLTEEASA